MSPHAGIAAEAASTAGCVAFNTNGFLKGRLQPMGAWVRWGEGCWGHGIYVRLDALVQSTCALMLRAIGACAPCVSSRMITLVDAMHERDANFRVRALYVRPVEKTPSCSSCACGFEVPTGLCRRHG